MKAIGIDIGTTSISGVVMDILSGTQISAKTIPNDTTIAGAPWSNEQDAGRICEKCQAVVAEYTERWKDIAAIGITGQMHGILYLDHQGNALSGLYTWEDERGNLEYTDGMSYAEYLTERTGFAMPTGYGLTTHFYNLKNGLVPEGACKISTIMDFVAMKLCRHCQPLMHISIAASLGCFDLTRGCFDSDALIRAGIDPQILPEVLAKEEMIGVTENGIPVVTPIGDNQAGILGVVSDDNDVVLNIGTSSQISMICSQKQDLEGLDCRPYIGGKYIILGAGLCGGISFGILNDFFCQVCRQSSVEISKERMFTLMMEAAEKTYEKDEDCVKVQTLFRGTRNEPQLRGSIENINMTNLTPGSLTLGFYRGVCEEMAEAYRKMPVRQGAGKLLLCGNALRNNRLLRQVCRDTFQREVYFADQKEEAAVGAAKLAMWVFSEVPEENVV